LQLRRYGNVFFVLNGGHFRGKQRLVPAGHYEWNCKLSYRCSRIYTGAESRSFTGKEGRGSWIKYYFWKGWLIAKSVLILQNGTSVSALSFYAFEQLENILNPAGKPANGMRGVLK
jgi:hypothetical protein